MNETEEWKDIVGYENLYKVSNFGNVMSFKRKQPHLLRPGKSIFGYLYVILIDNNKSRKVITIHRLVAKAFIENPKNLPCINHKDECKTNNKASNLEWCDQLYNVNYGTANERRSKILINRKDESKPVLQFDKNGNYLNEYLSIKDAERHTGIYKENICRVCRGERKRAGGYVWKYKNDYFFQILAEYESLWHTF